MTASELQAQAIVMDWFAGILQKSPAGAVGLADLTELRAQVEAAIQAEVARVRRETLLEAAALQCTHCRAGRPIVPPSNPVEHFAHQIKLSDPPAMREGWLICYAHEIHTLIAKEAAHER